MINRKPTVLLLIETSRGYGRGLLRGVIRWRQLHGPCQLVVSTGHFSKRLPSLLKPENLSGVIATITSAELADAVRKLHVPTIITEPSFNDFFQYSRPLDAAMISADHGSIVTMAYDYYLSNAFRNIAFCGIPNGWWAQRREAEFIRYLNEKGFDPIVYPCRFKPKIRHHWEEDAGQIARWLKRLPKPVGILACNDDRGRHLVQICHRENIAVPQDVAILGVDNDDLECELMQPTLSSIALDVESTGYRAMNVLMNATSSDQMSEQTILDYPLHIVERQSTGATVSDDPYIVLALDYIRNNFLLPIQVRDVVAFSGISRRSLERRFQMVLGCTILSEIQQRRLDRARQLLLHSSETVAKIALSSGFENALSLLRLFQEKLNCTPSEYRKLNQFKEPGIYT